MDKDRRILFVCAFGQSRSKFFAEKFMTLGYKAMFCGFDDLADFKISKAHIDWCDEIVLLDENWNKFDRVKTLISIAKENNVTIIEHYLEDDQRYFDDFCRILLDRSYK